MLGSQLDKIMKEKNSAFKVLVATQKKLAASCTKAEKFIDKNLNEINKKEQEILNKKDMNLALKDQVKHMEASIAETNRIVNPVIKEESSDVIEVEEIKSDSEAA